MDHIADNDEYVNIHMPPQHRIPLRHLAHGGYLPITTFRVILMGQMSDNEDYINAQMAPKGRNPVKNSRTQQNTDISC